VAGLQVRGSTAVVCVGADDEGADDEGADDDVMTVVHGDHGADDDGAG